VLDGQGAKRTDRNTNFGSGSANSGAIAKCRSEGKIGRLMNESQNTNALTRASAATRTPIGPENDSAITMQAGLTRRQLMFREIFEAGIVFRVSRNVTVTFTYSILSVSVTERRIALAA